MSVFLHRSCGAVLAYAVVAQGAFADVTAKDVWADWQSYMASVGYTVTGDEATSGNVTTISNMVMALDLPDTDGQIEITMPEMTMTENGDGTVSLNFPESFPIVLSGAGEGEEFSAEIQYTNSGLSMDVSGTPEDIVYDYVADNLTLDLTSITVGDETIPQDAMGANISINNVTGKTRMLVGEKRDVDQSFTASDATYAFVFDDPESDDAGQIRGQMGQLVMEGKSTIPTNVDATDVQAFYDAGFSGEGSFTYGSGSAEVQGTAEGESFSLSSSSEGGRLAGSIDAGHLAYDVEQNSAKVAVTTADLPFPIEVAMEKAGFKFDFPLMASDEIQSFSFGMNLTDFTMSDVLWSLFDPAGSLPRDPATIVVDTSGTGKVLVDFMDEEAVETFATGDVTPGELHSLKINELLVSLVGAKLTGDGDFTFDNTNTQAFGGMPTPAGVANLQLVGANALIDKLIGMGLITENDALGARMMMGLMAVPGEEPDTLNSKIEFTEDGQILANGQRLK
ncbi:DUF2125 domain-containing protein [Ruegeria sp. HKCCA5014]|uniref:DUF2125 domain-containing protein n=1 Tax=Ruegeria sp. HKCCA5014 TaxID=2682980 RepID=UPI001489FF7A|nr:DUF2125 domain-containing protein [Ruegeria sp. HKCCA5014]